MLPPHESWDQLQVFYGWEDNEAAYRAAWIRYQDALAMEVTVWFGKAWLLNSWTELFYALGMRDPPSNCAEGELVRFFCFLLRLVSPLVANGVHFIDHAISLCQYH